MSCRNSHLIADGRFKQAKMIFRQKPQNVVCKMCCCKMNTKFSHSNTHGAIKHIMTKTVANDDNILIKFSDDNDTYTHSA